MSICVQAWVFVAVAVAATLAANAAEPDVAPQKAAAQPVRLVSVERIWNQGKHNAFSSLVRFQDAWLCSFREGLGHAGDRGQVRVIRSTDAKNWQSAGVLAHELYDLRDPKLSQMPDGRLMIVGSAVDSRKPESVPGRARELRTFVSFSPDGRQWSSPKLVLGDWEWLWRVTWHEGAGYGVAYHVGLHMVTPRETRHGTLYRTRDGVTYEPLHTFRTPDGAGETTLRFETDGRMRLAMRRDGNQKRALLGTARPPFTQWELKDVSFSLGGPDLIQHPDGRWWLGTRANGVTGTALAQVDFDRATIEQRLTIPGRGDCSYPGFVWHDGKLWMSFYSSHEGQTAIYLATFAFDEAKP